MMRAVYNWFGGLPTPAKLLLILSFALFPIGLALVWVAATGVREANQALQGRTEDGSAAAAKAIESLVARNALSLKIAANGAFAQGSANPCALTQRSLAIAPGVNQAFELRGTDNQPICAVGDVGSAGDLGAVAPGDTQVRVATDRSGLVFRVGVNAGTATGRLPSADIQAAARAASSGIEDLYLTDGERRVGIIRSELRTGAPESRMTTQWAIGNQRLRAFITRPTTSITTIDRLLLLLPLVMWIVAALITWLLVARLIMRPLRILQRAVSSYQPGDSLDLPRRLGPSREIQDLRDSFARATARVEESENDMTAALDGQRRLVREVHHRVKNNLQVVASLLSIHGRSAQGGEARAAYASIGRRVAALSIVHRNHFAEMEENRGIALRPLLNELAAELRASAPEGARGVAIELEVEPAHTTQDVAVAVAFLMTEIVEFAMLNSPDDPVEASLRRTSELTARLTLTSKVLVPDQEEEDGKRQFERIVAGLARQLRSPLERKLGRYSVDLPIFPEA